MPATSRVVASTAADALEHDPPPISIGFDVSEAGMMVREFPGAGTYVSLSGPPGGPLFFSARHLGRGETLEDAARAGERRPMVFGDHDTVLVAGVERESVVFFVGESAAATVGCAVRIPAGGDDLVLVFGVGGRPGSVKSAAELGSLRAFKKILETFRAER